MTLLLSLGTKPRKIGLVGQVVLRQGRRDKNGMVMGGDENPNPSSIQKTVQCGKMTV